MFFKLAKWVTGHPYHIVAMWGGIVLLSLMFALRLPGALSTGGFNNPRSASAQAQRVLTRDFPQASPNTLVLIVQRSDETVSSPTFKNTVIRLAARLRDQSSVAAVTTYYATHAAVQVGDHGHATFIAVRLATASGNKAQNMVPGIQQAVQESMGSGFQWWITGGPALNQALNTATLHGVSHAERIAFPVLFLVLLLVLGTLVSAVIPLVLAVAVLPVAMAISYGIAIHAPLNVLLTDVISMIGLGVIVDYAVFIISRYRRERATYGTVVAVQRALATSGRAVFFSGLAVMVSLLALLLGRLMILTSIAIGGALVVLLAVVASWTLLPALLVLIGPRIERGRLPWHRKTTGTTNWTRWVTRIIRRPTRFLIPVMVILGVLIAPITRLHMQVPVASAHALPVGSSARQGLTVLERQFPKLALFPIDIVVQSHGAPMTSSQNLYRLTEIGRLVGRLPTASGVTSAVNWHPGWTVAQYYEAYQHWNTLSAIQRHALSQWFTPSHPHVALIEVPTTRSANSPATHRLVQRIRRVLQQLPGMQGLTTRVGGQTAVGYDFDQAVHQRFPLMVVVVFVISGLILAWTFRSIVLPLKALVLNALVTLASLGVLVAIFQQGAFGFVQAHHTLNSVTPVVLFAVLFGLSMDYEVFIVSHIREHHDTGAPTETSIIHGISETSRLVTGAAAIMIAVFVAFATVPIGVVQQLGIGLATAIFLDAVIVRTTLVPAVMRLLGESNWWGSRWWLASTPAAFYQPNGQPLVPAKTKEV